MSKKPHEAQADDLLEQIIAQGLDKLKAPTQAEAREEAEAAAAPRQEDSGDTASPADNKNRRSAVYLYLLVLFGAAFLMLLLAYFVQRRTNEDALSDLRDSMNLSRTELLEQIRELEEQKAALEEQNAELEVNSARLNHELAQWQEQYEEKEREAADLWNQNYDAQEELYSWRSFWTLEQFYQAEDYERCAAVLILQGQGQFTYRIPDGAQERQEEIVQAVIDAGLLDEDYYLHPEQYEDLLDAYFDRFGSWPPER